MNPETPAPRRRLAAPVRVVRRVLAPAGLEVEVQLASVRLELADLRAADDEVRVELALDQERAGRLTGRLARHEEALGGPDGRSLRELASEVTRLREGLHEERRLQLRVAELTDLVTELVLPLHDREIDPAVLRRLRPDTL